ncbi:MAG: bifunctional UDP-N-acetylglucosamine diphosphorylase/glucosamine-1-phosphate N-acetyltransferase GlmU [Alphaproteobacteria bacterium]|nr:bifunctional UDP-N-acetylglucosamine diphosphorylase/glucosamine-1-phosphate N-acetyltransferase GlmU [Alphaproteobacteria bacterium]
MSKDQLAVVVLAAGKGTRMKSARSKVLHSVAGRSLLGHVLDTAATINPDRLVVVIGPDMEEVAAEAAPHEAVVQAEQRGTADAVKAARQPLADVLSGTVFIVYGDTPFIEAETLNAMAAQRAAGAGVVVLGFRPDDPAAYGRLITDNSSRLERIVEFREANEVERAVTLCNSGVMAVDASILFRLVDAVDDDNAKNEFYLTDIVALARADNIDCVVVEAEADELQGINSRIDLAAAEAFWQQRRRLQVMEEGVTLSDPATVYFSYDTKFAEDVLIGPNVVFGPGVSVGRDAEIRAFCHLEGVIVGDSVTVGPFARLRPGVVLERGVKIGNFVEVKNAVLGAGAKASHLSYIGDAEVGANANIGAGTITCNYDGYFKYKTTIGSGAFIGSNTALVAPVVVGDGAIVGAGSVITDDVKRDALAVGRGRQDDREGWAAEFRTTQQTKKDQVAKGDD